MEEMLRHVAAAAAALVVPWAAAQTAAQAPAALEPCRLAGVEHGALCGRLLRPLDPAQPAGRMIELQFAVLPALARNKKPDPIFFFAGGPGQSAIDLAGPLSQRLARFSNQRDIVLIDQRGTGRSAPLKCADERATRPLSEMFDAGVQAAQLLACRQALSKLPHGDLRQYTTTIAMQDAEAVRRVLDAKRINLVGASYGTRAVLEYLRQYPQRVRRVVIDGVAPPDMVLPASFSLDNQAAFDQMLNACAKDSACAGRYPLLNAQWRALLGSLPREVTLLHPITQREERVTLTRDAVASMVRQPLYVPALAAALPLAVSEAAQGRFAALVGLGSALAGGRRGMGLAQGMHFSVVCAEDMPRFAASADAPSPDFGGGFADVYKRVCADWPRGEVPAAFYTVPPTASATLVFSGGADPATPSRHGARVARLLGPRARHVVVTQAGHGVSNIGCVRDMVFRFIDAASDEEAIQVDTSCVQNIPRPTPYLLPAP